MGTFIADGSAVLPAVKSDARPPTGAVTEFVANDANQLRSAALDLRTEALAEATARAAGDAAETARAVAAEQAIIAAGVPVALSGSSFVTATGSTTARTLAERFADWANVLDYGADPTGVVDSTAAFLAAQVASRFVRVPEGTFKLNNLRILNGRKIVGSGSGATVLQQASGSAYVLNILSNGDTVGGSVVGQLLDVVVEGVHILGTPGASVHVVNVEAAGVFAVWRASLDFTTYDTYGALRVEAASANNVYQSHFTVSSYKSTGTAIITTGGVYNEFDLFCVDCDGYALEDGSWDSLFRRVVTDGCQKYSGQNNVVHHAVIENIHAASPPSPYGIRVDGYQHVFVRPTLTTVNGGVITHGWYFNSSTTTLISPRILGTAPGSAPVHVALMVSGSAGTIIDFVANGTGCTMLDVTNSGTVLQNWQFIGNCSDVVMQPPKNGAKWTRITPSVSGSTVTIDDNCEAFLIQPTAPLAALTVTLPPNPRDGQILRIAGIQNAITAITISPNVGQFVLSMPTALAAGAAYGVIYTGGYWFPC